MNKKLINLLVLCCFLANIPLAGAQHLQKRVSLTAKQEKLYKVLNRMEEQCGFNFSYSGDLLKKDSLLSVQLIHVPVWEALNRIFNYNVEYHETGNYIVLRSAEHRFSIFPGEISADSRKYKISGYVLDERTGKGVKDASVYEKKLLRSALTNRDGYFSLKFRGEYNSVMLTASKANYRDTTMFFLTDVKVKPEGYYDDRKTNFFIRNFNNTIERFGVNKFLVSSKRRIQSLNIPGFFASSPFQASFLPGLGSQGLMSSQVINKGSLNMIGGYSAGVNGAEVAGVFNITKNDVKKFQSAGVFNITGGSVSGVQVSGLSNTVFGKLYGWQFAGAVNQVKDSVEGGQFAGLLNHAKQSVKGIQFAGLTNFANNNVEGVQIAGLFNQSRNIKGIQFAGLFNANKNFTKGVQLSGILNYSKNINGLQVGLINLAGSSSGIGIGLLNFYKNGYRKISIYTDEMLTANIALKTGNARLYSVLTGGINVSENQFYTFGFGLGHDVNISKQLLLNLTASSHVFFADKKSWFPVSYKFSPAIEYNLTPKISGFAGLSYNIFIDDTGKNLAEPIVKVYPSWSSTWSNNVKSWFGGNLGIGFSL